MQSQLVDKAAEEAGSALAHRYQQKQSKYGEACLAEGIVFTPVVFEVLGGLKDVSISVVKKLQLALAHTVGQDTGEWGGHETFIW